MHITIKEKFMMLAIEEMKGIKERRPTIEELNKYFLESRSPWKKYNNTTHWCGIFAAYLLRKAGANVSWVWRRGIHNVIGADNPEGNLYVRTFFSKKQGDSYINNIAVGDICVRGVGQHHFIVLEPPDEHGTFGHCVEGNYGGLDNPLLHQGKRAKNNKHFVHTYYRVF